MILRQAALCCLMIASAPEQRGRKKKEKKTESKCFGKDLEDLERLTERAAEMRLWSLYFHQSATYWTTLQLQLN